MLSVFYRKTMLSPQDLLKHFTSSDGKSQIHVRFWVHSNGSSLNSRFVFLIFRKHRVRWICFRKAQSIRKRNSWIQSCILVTVLRYFMFTQCFDQNTLVFPGTLEYLGCYWKYSSASGAWNVFFLAKNIGGGLRGDSTNTRVFVEFCWVLQNQHLEPVPSGICTQFGWELASSIWHVENPRIPCKRD